MVIKNRVAALSSLLFVVMIALPMVVSVVQRDADVSYSEKRRLQAWPSFSTSTSLKDYFSDLSAYANDQFGYREQLIGLNNKLSLWFSQSPVESVIIGKRGWMFFGISDPLLSSHSKTKAQIKNNLASRVAHTQKMQAELQSRGVAYQYMVVPNKMNLYSEHLPNVYGLTNIKASYELFMQSFDPQDAEFVFDVEQALREKKENQYGYDLYFKNDSHWNQLGAYYATLALYENVRDRHPDIELGRFTHNIRAYFKYAGDLADYIGVGNQLRVVEPFMSHPSCTDKSRVINPKPNINLFECKVNPTKVLLIGDSFTGVFYPFLAQSVGSLYGISRGTPKAEVLALVDEIKPDLVIEQIVERKLAAGQYQR